MALLRVRRREQRVRTSSCVSDLLVVSRKLYAQYYSEYYIHMHAILCEIMEVFAKFGWEFRFPK